MAHLVDLFPIQMIHIVIYGYKAPLARLRRRRTQQ